MTIKKTITLSQEDYDFIIEHTKKRGRSFSEFLRDSTIRRIKGDLKMSMLEFLNTYAKKGSEEENREYQERIASGELDLDDMSDAEELKLEDVL